MDAVRRYLVFVALLLVAGPGLGQAGEASAAKEIQELSGVRRGLCLHLGCGREGGAGLAAALAANPDLPLHGLALDEAALARARSAAEAAGVAGRAMFERLASNALPYLDNLANLVVVEEPAAFVSAGIGEEEFLRVAAPGGVLLVREAEGWRKTVKAFPADTDSWPQVFHGADLNPVSTDKRIVFPVGIKWIDGLPVCLNQWGSTRGVVVAGGRVFTVSSNEYENLGPAIGSDHYLSARDAFNGLPLWKIKCGPAGETGAGLNWRNTAPLLTDAQGKRVYTRVDGKLAAVDGESGKVLHAMETRAPAARLLLCDGVLVASCWKEKVNTNDEFDGGGLWPTWVPKTEEGSIEAFAAETGQSLWAADFPAFMLMAEGTTLYVLTTQGQPTEGRALAALDLKSGKERWRVAHTEFGTFAGLQLNTCGPGYAVVSQRGRGNKTPMKSEDKGKDVAVFVLSAEDGKILWKIQPARSSFTPVVGGKLWLGTEQYDPLTGKVVGKLPGVEKNGTSRPALGGASSMCAASNIAGHTQLNSRGCVHTTFDLEADPPALKKHGYFGARGACIQGLVPAHGMLFTAQNACKCEPAQPFGFLGLQSLEWPSPAEFTAERPVEKGPAYGAAAEEKQDEADWPTFRKDAYRSARTAVQPPEKLGTLWQAEVASPGEGLVANAWTARVESTLSAPVIAAGRVYVAAVDAGQIFALDAATGQKVWSVSLGGRVDSPPTLYGGLCVAGCHDGWVYALRAADGELAWRTRLAPRERRMVAYGQVASIWPVIGTVMAHDGLLYATAGRTTASDGGLVMAALDPATGATRWIEPYRTDMYGCLNDLFFLIDGELGFRNRFLDLKTGKPIKKNLKGFYNVSHGGRIDGTWTMVSNNNRRSGRAYHIGKFRGNLMAWDGEAAVMEGYAVARAKLEELQAGKKEAVEGEAKKQSRKERLRGINDEDLRWEAEGFDSATQQIEAIVLAGKHFLYAGRAAAEKASAWTYFLHQGRVEDGKKLCGIALEAAPSYDGMAVAQGKVFVSLRNGKILCLGDTGNE